MLAKMDSIVRRKCDFGSILFFADFVEMKPVEVPSGHPLTSPGMTPIHDNRSARHLALVSDFMGCVFNGKIRAIQRRLIAEDYVDGIELHQFVMHAELVLNEEDIIMADTLLAALGVGPSGDVPVVAAGFVTEAAFDKLKRNPRFEERVNPDDDEQVGVLHLDNGKCVKIQRRASDIVPVSMTYWHVVKNMFSITKYICCSDISFLVYVCMHFPDCT